MRFFLLGLLFAAASAHAAKWEYKTVDYDTKDKFVPVLAQLGQEGWELVACPTTGSSPYSAIIGGSNGGSFTGYVGRSVYCIFKREL